MTSNVGSGIHSSVGKIGFAVSASDETRQKETGEEMKDKIKTALENRFRPEFQPLGRDNNIQFAVAGRDKKYRENPG